MNPIGVNRVVDGPATKGRMKGKKMNVCKQIEAEEHTS